MPPPLSVTSPWPSRTTRCLVLGTLAVAVITIVTGLLPQLKLMIPPAATARTTASDVQPAGVPLPITWFGWLVLTALPAGGTGKCPFGLPKSGRTPVRVALDDAPAAAGGCTAPAGAPRASETIAPARAPAPTRAVATIPKPRILRTAPYASAAARPAG